MQTENLWHGNVQQQVFRELVEVFARPGEVRNLSPWVEGSTALRTVLATLMDGETTLADPHGRIAAADWPLLQVKPGATETARYIAADGRRVPDFQPSLGSLESPDFGATLLIEVDALGSGPLSLELAGPGICGWCELSVTGLHTDWLRQRLDWVNCFPLGVDMLLLDAQNMIALPRTTRISHMVWAI